MTTDLHWWVGQNQGIWLECQVGLGASEHFLKSNSLDSAVPTPLLSAWVIQAYSFREGGLVCHL